MFKLIVHFGVLCQLAFSKLKYKLVTLSSAIQKSKIYSTGLKFRQQAAKKLILRSGKMWLPGGRDGFQRGIRNLLEVIETLISWLLMDVVIQMYMTVKIHQTVDIKWIHFIVQKLHLNKLLKNKGTSIYVKCTILWGPRPWGEDSCVSDLFSGCSQKTPEREWGSRTRREEESSRMWSQAKIPRGLRLALSRPWDRNLTVCSA